MFWRRHLGASLLALFAFAVPALMWGRRLLAGAVLVGLVIVELGTFDLRYLRYTPDALVHRDHGGLRVLDTSPQAGRGLTTADPHTNGIGTIWSPA